MNDRIVASYELPGSAAEAARAAKAIAFEETVEVPLDFPLSAKIRDEIVGKVRSVSEIGSSRSRVEIEFPARLAAGRISSLLNLIFGNASIWPGVRLVDVQFPESFLAALPGPNHGVKGLRKLAGVKDRPLLATALKPMGSSDAELAKLAAAFAAGGGDLVKDDQNIVDADFAKFRSRVERVAQSVAHENARSGRRCLYLPHLSGPQEELGQRLEFVLKLGLAGVLICPAITGLDEVRRLAQEHRPLLMAHPAFSGAFYAEKSHGIDTALYLGTFMRLIGADITVFPNAGGRFSFTSEECRNIAVRGRAPLGKMKPIWPAPGGGMSLENTGAMAKDFGPDAIWLVGGRLLMQSGGAQAGARAFREAISRAFLFD